MPKIAGVFTAVPEHTLYQTDVKQFARYVFNSQENIDTLLTVFDNAQIEKRHFVVDLDWFAEPHNFTEVNDLYIEEALTLSERVVCGLADQVGISTKEFDAIIFISTTGLSTPSIDARLFNRIALNNHIVRMPMWGLGCAGGAAGIARAFDYATAHPKAKVLVVSVELCGLAFKDRVTKSNIISTALFADGAAACLITGNEVELNAAGPAILGSLSTIYDDTLDVMGWHISEQGLEVVLSKDIPSIVTTLVKENISELLERYHLTFSDITHYVTHPGGRKVLEGYKHGIGVTDQDLRHSLNVLREFGNMSSATVFFILERFMKEVQEGNKEYGLLSALGPGFSSELVLLQWK